MSNKVSSTYVSQRVELKLTQDFLLIVTGKRKYSYPLINSFRFDPFKKRLFYDNALIGLKKKKGAFGVSKVLLSQAFVGSQLGYQCRLNLVGIGYNFLLENKNTLVLKAGYSHKVSIDIPKEIEVKLMTPRKLLLEGVNYQKIYNFACYLQTFKLPNPYKEKGIYLEGRKTRSLKSGKKT